MDPPLPPLKLPKFDIHLSQGFSDFTTYSRVRKKNDAHLSPDFNDLKIKNLFKVLEQLRKLYKNEDTALSSDEVVTEL